MFEEPTDDRRPVKRDVGSNLRALHCGPAEEERESLGCTTPGILAGDIGSHDAVLVAEFSPYMLEAFQIVLNFLDGQQVEAISDIDEHPPCAAALVLQRPHLPDVEGTNDDRVVSTLGKAKLTAVGVHHLMDSLPLEVAESLGHKYPLGTLLLSALSGS